MPRQPNPGAGARTPSGAAARTPAPQPPSPLLPERYRDLRARYNALLIALYERSTLTLREIAAIAGRTARHAGQGARLRLSAAQTPASAGPAPSECAAL